MSWRERIAALVVFVLAAVPAGRTICASACTVESPAAAAHHAAGGACQQMAPADSASTIDGDRPDDCGTHDAALEYAATRPAERAAVSAIAAAIPLVSFGEWAIPPATFTHPTWTAPPGSDPPTTTPLVLRI